MEKALISIKENSFKEEMLKRLKSIEEDKSKMKIRLDNFEKDRKSSESYSFKEEKSHNQVKVSSEVMSEVVQVSRFESNYVESKLEDCYEENIVDNVEESDQEDGYENSELRSSFIESETEYSCANGKISCHEEQEDEVVVESNENNSIRKDDFKESKGFIDSSSVQVSARDVYIQEDNDLDEQEDNDVDFQEDSSHYIQEDINRNAVSTTRSVRTKPPTSRRGFKNRLQSAFKSRFSKIAKRCSVLIK